ncbi:MAG: N,N-dimethylformamidase beta subunit family domain-containing protein [Candidatus Binatia bacterium]
MTTRSAARRPARFWQVALAALALGCSAAGAASAQNPIVTENALPGSPASEWDVSGAGDASIQGFATDISVNRGETVVFKIDTDATAYRLDLYRLGWYAGLGARHVATVLPAVALPQNQPACLADGATGLVDCGNWAASAQWAVPASATSGVYLAKLVREDPEDGRASHIAFVVRDDSGGSDILFQTADTTWQAYNQYGGNSLYVGAPAGRAYKVSYNRPFATRGVNPEDWVFNAESPMIRWLERNGYDVSYFTGVDADRRGSELLEHGLYLSVGHDEYWSGGQRSAVEAARDAGVHLAFFSGNEVFWKTRWETSIDGSGTPHRTLVSYKETHANAKIDPLPGVWTGTWRDDRFSPPADGGRPENGLTGTIFTVNCCSYAMTVPAADGKMRFWRNTSVATLGVGQSATLAGETVGYEWDEDLDNGARPAGLVRLSTTTNTVAQRILDLGSSYGPGVATHRLTMYRAASGALVFGAGTVQWSWGLDDTHDRGGDAADGRMQQATLNLFADMGVQAATRQAGLVAASASTDHTAPSATIAAPAAAFVAQTGVATTISGSATDAGGGVVGGVEVSVDGGATWHPAAGRGSWTYAWTPTMSGAATLRARAVDDSGNLGAASAPVSGSVEPHSCPACLPPGEGPGGPILVIASAANPFSRYYAEVLLAEGLNAFEVVDIADVTPSLLDAYEIAILGELPLAAGGGEGGSAAVVSMLSDWVDAGGKLIAMRPDPLLAPLLGLTPAAGTLSDAYLLIQTAAAPGAGLVNQTIQFHGTADRYTLNGATALATLYSGAATATANPAVTRRAVGSQGGIAAAFTYDLARSVVYTRQGNPLWIGQERDGIGPLRSDDLFYGPASFDPQPNWIDLNKVAIPQADEQQRLLANLILGASGLPLPRFWYFPRDERAVVILTGDQHGCCGGTRDRFDIHVDQSPAGCSVANWECVRATSYIYASANMDDAEAAAWNGLGFELGVHVNTGCADWSPSSLAANFDSQFLLFAGLYPSLPSPATNRTHCIAWSDWATQARVEADRGVRLDTNYYYWPPGWVQNRPGMFTGSGMPMRFADEDGTLIDAYQAATQLTDESDQVFPFTIDALLDKAIGAQGYYGAFTANMHTDTGNHSGANAIVASAQARSVPLVSGRQMLDWLDGRNASAFVGLEWNGWGLSFSVAVGPGANGLRAMLPPAPGGFPLASLTRNGAPWPFALQTIKGISYAVFDGTPGAYVATYSVDADGDGSPLPADCNDLLASVRPGLPDICNGIDDDCDLATDEGNPGGSAACSTGQSGVCAAGTTQCSGGSLQCLRNVAPSAESCDGSDNDCDGVNDDGNPGGGVGCSTGQSGVCAAGTTQCSAGALQCVRNIAPSPEVCDGLDNNCSGGSDEGNPGGGVGCATGQPGPCAAGTRQCSGGTLLCVANVAPAPEVCDGSDNDCDGTADDGNPGGGASCGVTDVGACALGSMQCQSGALQCIGRIDPTAEVCDAVDNDCDGTTDDGDPGSGAACTTGELGVCAAGIRHCSAGALACVRTSGPSAELCNSVDDDCDGVVDDGTSGGACSTGQLGACGAGTSLCVGGSPMCQQNVPASAETCNNVDDDCDGSTDEGNPGAGAACSTGLPGLCAAGTTQCQAGLLQCVASGAVPEVCNGLDDDCDGTADDGDPGGNASCASGASGACAAGTLHCQGGAPTCVANVAPTIELCATGIDESCDGATDEPACELCLAANTVGLDTQTKRSSIKLRASDDRVITKGRIALPVGVVVSPASEPVTVQVRDGAGGGYLGTLAAGTLIAAPNNRSWKFKDAQAPYENGGLQTARLGLGQQTLTYLFKARGLALPPFAGGTGSVTVRIGTRCFTDPTDTCSVTPSGSSAKCR